MSTFIDRSALLEQLLGTRRSASEGGWPQKLGIRNAPTTIVATAQALEILRIRGLEYENLLIQGGLRYLAEQVRVQMRQGTRGVWNRYPAYALWGLMRFPTTRWDPQLASGILFSYDWLRKFALPAGGWSESRNTGPLWLPGTMVAVHALDRLTLYSGEPMSSTSKALVSAARDHIMSEARPVSKSQMQWSQTPNGESCPGATSLAVLTLARGTEQHRQVARAGIRWLAETHEKWSQLVHADDQVESRRWRIMTFSLGLRALLHPCEPHDLDHPAVTQAVQHIDTLWKPEDQGWGDRPGLEASVSGSYAVVAAVHTLKRAWPFDPFETLNIATKRLPGRVSSPRTNRVLLIARRGRMVRVDDDAGVTQVEAKIKGPAQWSALLMLAERHHENAGSGDQSKMTVSILELAQSNGNGTDKQPESVIRTIKRLNQLLALEAKTRTRQLFVDLIEDHTPPGTDDRCYALEEIEVRFVDRLPILSDD